MKFWGIIPAWYQEKLTDELASIMVFTNMAIIETEQEQGSAMKYVLKL